MTRKMKRVSNWYTMIKKSNTMFSNFTLIQRRERNNAILEAKLLKSKIYTALAYLLMV
jgi:hypothetical protein